MMMVLTMTIELSFLQQKKILNFGKMQNLDYTWYIQRFPTEFPQLYTTHGFSFKLRIPLLYSFMKKNARPMVNF